MVMRILFYALTVIAIGVLVYQILKANGQPGKVSKKRFRLRTKTERENWVQVYDTDSWEEVQSIQARLEEEELECFIYEQGRKDIHGNPLKGFGIAVPRASVSHAQRIIARMPT